MPGAISFSPRSFYLPDSVPGYQGFSDHWQTVVGMTFDHESDEDSMSRKDGSITLRGVLIEVRLRKLQASRGSTFGVIPKGVKACFETVVFDHEPEHDELQSVWTSVTPDWVTQGTTDSESTHALQLTRDVEDEFPLPALQGNLQSAHQYTEIRWAFCLGTWHIDPGGVDKYLLLERIDESSQSFRRLGQGECTVKKSFFREIHERQVIVMK